MDKQANSTQIYMDSSKLKEFADYNFKFDENGRRFSKQVENTVGKGEIVRYEQFLLFQRCFPEACAEDMKNPGIVWKRVKMYPQVCFPPIHRCVFLPAVLVPYDSFRQYLFEMDG